MGTFLLPRYRAPVYVDGWTKARAEGGCRFCGRAWSVRAPTRHHLVPSSWFRANPRHRALRNDGRNLVPLCRPCHDLVDGRADLRRQQARAMLRALLTQAEVAFVVATAGLDWLDGEYPPRRVGDVADVALTG